MELTGHVMFRGRAFRLGPCTAVAPMLDFAQAAAKGLDSDDPAGLAAMKDMVEGCFTLTPSCGVCEACLDERYSECGKRDTGDWPKFWRLFSATGGDADELMEVVTKATEAAMARPTPARSGSSSPARKPSPRSRGSSSSPAQLPAAFRDLPAGDLIGVDDALR